MGKDKRGVNRGNCQKCDCKEYEVFDKRLLCDYCGHRPVDHNVQEAEGRPRRRCSPKKEQVLVKKKKTAEVPVIKVEPSLTVGSKRILPSDGPVTRRSQRNKPQANKEKMVTEQENKDDEESQDNEPKVEATAPKPSRTRRGRPTKVKKEPSDNAQQESVVEMELDEETKESQEKQTEEPPQEDEKGQERENPGQEIELVEENLEQKIEFVEALPDEPSTSRPRRVRAGLKMSKLVERERNSDESADEEMEEDDKFYPHHCNKCERRFKLLSNLIIHKKEHTQRKYNQRRYMCQVCDTKFSTHYDLRRHLISHNTKAEPLSCGDCGKEYKDEQALSAHKKVHASDHIFACNICSKTFTRRHDLKRHQVSVHEDYHYMCGMCGLAYKSQKTLTNHEVIHLQSEDSAHVEDTSVLEESVEEEEPPLEGASQTEVIEMSSPMKTRKKSYTVKGDKIFQCMLCVKGFASKDNLRQHILAHAGKFQYVCDFCGQGFHVPKQLKDHISSAHGDTTGREFHCAECCCCFVNEEELLKHGEWHGEKDNKIRISNKKLVEIIKKLDSLSSDQFLTEPSIWSDLNRDFDSTEQSTEDSEEHNEEVLAESVSATVKTEQMEEGTEEGEIKIQIQLDTSQEAETEDLDDDVANKLLFRNPRQEKVSKPFACKVCLRTFSEKMYCRCHVLAHVGMYKHQCTNCALGFLKSSDLKRHTLRCKKSTRKQKSAVMQCSDCQLLFENEIEYMQHRNDVCAKFWTNGGILDSAAVDSDQKSSIIESLQAEMRTSPENFIIIHDGVTNSGRPVRTCTVEGCELQFMNRPQLKHHLKQAHGIVLGPVARKGDEKKIKIESGYKEGLVCAPCNKTFKNSVQLSDHKSAMHGEKSYSCSICGKAFGRKFDCQRHEENVHHGTNTSQCNICGKVCKDKYSVQTHKKVVHDQIKDHICPTCGHKFSQKSNLNNHMRTHTNEKPFQCSECLKWFSTRQYRDSHMRNHTGERPHRCTYCSRTFSHPASLKYHIRTHEDDRPYPCFTCPRKFRDPSKRSKHARTCPGEQSVFITRSIQGQTVIEGQGQTIIGQGQTQTVIATEEDGQQVTLQLDQSVIDNLLLEPETTQIQIVSENDETIEQQHVQQIEQLIQENQIQLDEDGTQYIVMDQGGSGERDMVYVVLPGDGTS